MRILVTGASGQLGGYLLRELQRRGLPTHGWSGSRTGELFGCVLQPVELTNVDAVTREFASVAPHVVIHAAAIARIADCYREPEKARLVNCYATALLSELCLNAGARLVYVSTDLVFDGRRGNYREEDDAAPLSVYGRAKLDAEADVLASRRGLVARVSLLYGPSLTGRASFFDEQIAAIVSNRPMKLFVDEWRTPLDLPTAASALVALALSERAGLFHVGGPERLSRWEMGRELAAFLGAASDAIVASKQAEVATDEPRPRDVSFDSSKWRAAFPEQPWPTMREALRQMCDAGLFSHLPR
jgi:dTDP-4-dehydrorhamnose reductase